MSRIEISRDTAPNLVEYVKIAESTPDDVVVVAAREERMIAQVQELGYEATDGRHAVAWLGVRSTHGWYDTRDEPWAVQTANNRLHSSERDPETGHRLLLAAVRAGTTTTGETAIIAIGMTFPSETAGESDVFVAVDTTLHSQGHYWQVADNKMGGIPVYQPLASGSVV